MGINSKAITGETERLCAFVSDTTYDDISDEAVEHAKRMILDTLGVTIVGSKTEVAAFTRDVKTSIGVDTGLSRVPGTGTSGTPRDVAVLTGVMAHALDFDDVHHQMGGHPSAAVLAALLPVAERESASGRELLTAFILGTEVEITLADVLNPGHYERGWHPTSVLGTIGAAVAVGKLLGLETLRLQRAVGISASEAGGIKSNFGTMTKPLHVGNAARSGIEVAELASRGFTASENALEAEFGGFCDLFEGTPGYDFNNHLEALGSPWGLLDPPVGFKPYPCCGSTHSAIDAALALRNHHEFDMDDIDSVEIREHPRRLDHTNEPKPETTLDAKFSVQYCVAVALREGNVWLNHFEQKNVKCHAYQSFLENVDVAAARSAFDNREWGACVAVHANGERHAVEIDAPKGGAENPLTQDELEKKYRRCVEGTLTKKSSRRSLSMLLDLDSKPDVSSVLNHLTNEK